jgi:hypothetical protein
VVAVVHYLYAQTTGEGWSCVCRTNLIREGAWLVGGNFVAYTAACASGERMSGHAD